MMKKIGFSGLFLVGLLMQGSAQDNAISNAINTNNNVSSKKNKKLRKGIIFGVGGVLV